MNNNNKAQMMVNFLEQEINWIEKLNTLLSEEKIVLATRQFDQLEDLANQKQELSAKLEESARQRTTLINLSNATSENPGLSLKEFLRNCSPDEANLINKLNNALVERLTMCRELNTVNGQVIANNIHTRQQIVNALSGNNADAMSVYTANGNLKSTTETKHHQEA